MELELEEMEPHDGDVDIGSVDLSQVITLQLVFSPAPWVRSVGYTLLVITIR